METIPFILAALAHDDRDTLDNPRESTLEMCQQEALSVVWEIERALRDGDAIALFAFGALAAKYTHMRRAREASPE